MNVKCGAVMGLSVVLLCAGSLLQAQQSTETFAATKAKAEKGDAKAQCALGFCYNLGNGVAKDEVEAVKWFRKAAEQNNAEAQINLGKLYGEKNDGVEMVRWYRKAAEQNDAEAQRTLGVCYAKGIGVEEDKVEAVKWFRKAAEQNDAEAQLNLGTCYTLGNGVAKDAVQAAKWYRKAAEQNYASAQFLLGFCYSKGKGVPEDGVECYKWTFLAAEQGDKLAKKRLTELESEMTREQIAEGQRLARNFKPRLILPAGN